MLNSFLLAVRFLTLIFIGHKQVALENIALRHQLAVFTREKKRPRLRDRDRLFCIALKKLYKDWRAALAFVQPETVVDEIRESIEKPCTFRVGAKETEGPDAAQVESELDGVPSQRVAGNILILPGVIQASLWENALAPDRKKVRDINGRSYRI